MTKKLVVLLVAVVGLSGCVAVPVYDAPPAYGYYYPGAPAASVSFGYYDYGPRYRHGPRHGHGRGHGHGYGYRR